MGLAPLFGRNREKKNDKSTLIILTVHTVMRICIFEGADSLPKFINIQSQWMDDLRNG